MRLRDIFSALAALLLAGASGMVAANDLDSATAGIARGTSGSTAREDSTAPCKPALTEATSVKGAGAASTATTNNATAGVSAGKPCAQANTGAVRLASAAQIGSATDTAVVAQATAPAAELNQPAGPASAPVEALAEVKVTGSRISRQDFVSDQPIVTTSAEQLASAGKINVETALEQMPQFLAGQDENYNSNGPNGGRAELNLRGLGTVRTLVLLDGRRLSPTDGTGVADLNQIPQSIVESVQVITGGASAAYGSDAMAGVVNIITKNVDGVELNASHGSADGGYGSHTDLSLAMGSAFADGKGHVTASFESTKRAAIGGWQLPFFYYGGQGVNIPYGAYSPATAPQGLPANLPSQAAVNAYFAQFGVPAGSVLNTYNLNFNNNGTLFSQRTPFSNYQGIPICQPRQTGCLINVAGTLELPTGQTAYVTTPENRYSGFAKATYTFNDYVGVYLQVLANSNKVDTQSAFQQISTSPLLSIPVTNPFIPASLAGILASRPNPTAPFTFNKRLMDFPPSIYQENFDTDQFIVGAKGKIPGVLFDWDFYYTHDYALDSSINNGNVSIYRVQTLLSAPDGGNSICAGGFNPFTGYHSYVSPQCLAYMSVATHATTVEGQDTVEGSVGGKMVTLPAGDARFDLVADWRQWTSAYSPDSLNILGNPPSSTVSGANPTKGEISLAEIAGEVLIPVLKDKPFAQSWNLNLAYRESHYNIAGGTNAYKFNTDWTPVRGILFRGGFEHAIRAPNMNDLFQAQTTVSQNIGNPPIGGDPCDYRSALRNGPNAAQITAICLAQGIPASQIGTYAFQSTSTSTQASGSLGVKPETGNTFTAGAVFTPEFENAALAHMQLSLDYYHIKISDAIGASGYTYVINACYNVNGGNPTYSPNNAYCQLINRNATGVPGATFYVGQPTMNLGGELTSGVDAELDWAWHLADMGLGSKAGQLHLNSTLSWIGDFQIQTVPNAPWNNYAGTISELLAPIPPLPKWHALTSLNYLFAPVPVTVGLRWRYINAMRDSSTVLTPTSKVAGVPTYNYLDFTAGWKITDYLDVNFTATNIMGRIPPIVNNTPGHTQPQLYDVTNTYLISVRARF